MSHPRGIRLYLDVAVAECTCATPGCIRIIPPGDTIIMRELEGSARPRCAESLCVPCGSAAQEDARLQVRVWLHAERQARAST